MYAGFYINLDRRPERRAEMDSELSRVGLHDRYTRFPAVEGNALNISNPHLKPGEIGCFSSHTKVLEQGLGNASHVHIIEDDVIFAKVAGQTIDRLAFQGPFSDYDIIYTDIAVPLLNDAFKAFKSFYDATVKRNAEGEIAQTVFSVINLKGLVFGSASSYLVNKGSLAKAHKLFSDELQNEPTLPVDLLIRRLANEGALNVGCIFPFVTSVRLDHIVQTDIARGYKGVSALASHLGRYSFFIDADFNRCEALLKAYMPLPAESDRHTKILNHLLAYSMTDGYRAV